jgi:uncharacterized protein YqgV (UPF0045/DUF77 family)
MSGRPTPANSNPESQARPDPNSTLKHEAGQQTGMLVLAPAPEVQIGQSMTDVGTNLRVPDRDEPRQQLENQIKVMEARIQEQLKSGMKAIETRLQQQIEAQFKAQDERLALLIDGQGSTSQTGTALRIGDRIDQMEAELRKVRQLADETSAQERDLREQVSQAFQVLCDAMSRAAGEFGAVGKVLEQLHELSTNGTGPDDSTSN